MNTFEKFQNSNKINFPALTKQPFHPENIYDSNDFTINLYDD